MDAKRMVLTIGPLEQGFYVDLRPVGMQGVAKLEGDEALAFLQEMRQIFPENLDRYLYLTWVRLTSQPAEAPAENLTLGERMTALEKRLDVLIEQTRKPTDADLWDTFQRMRQQEAFRSGV